MYVKVDLASFFGEKETQHKFEVQAFNTLDAKMLIWALKRILKSAQSVWPNELGEVMIINKYTGKPPVEADDA